MDNLVFDPEKLTPRLGVGSRLQTWMARLFGRRVEGTDGRTTIISYQWRGRLFVVAERTRAER